MQAQLGEEEYDEGDDDQIIDHNDVNIIDNGADYNEDDNQMDSNDGEERLLNRQTDNMGKQNQMNQNMQNGVDVDDLGAYGDEVINHQNSSNFNMDQHDDEGLEQLHDQLKNLDQEDDENYDQRNS